MNLTTLPHVLVTDGDADDRELMSKYLGGHALRVTTVGNGHAMFRVLDSDAVDLVLLDVKLPGEDGLQLVRQLRQRASIPIMVVSGQSAEIDRVRGLEFGADDYVAKPFGTRELLARIRALLRRSQAQALLPQRDDQRRGYRFAGWELSLVARRLASPDGVSVDLSKAEFSLLAALCRAPRRVLTRAQLLSMSRLHEGEVDDRAVDVQIRRLRVKLGAGGGSRLIVTQRGAGYGLACDVVPLY